MFRSVLFTVLISLSGMVRVWAGSEVDRLWGGVGPAERPVLLPVPWRVAYKEGRLALADLSLFIPTDAPAAVRFALNELKEMVAVKTGRAVRMAAQATEASFHYTVKRGGGEVPGGGEKTDNVRENYAITISSREVRVDANTST